MKAKYVILGLFLLLTLLVSSVFVSADCAEMQDICESTGQYTFYESPYRDPGNPKVIAVCYDASTADYIWVGTCFPAI